MTRSCTKSGYIALLALLLPVAALAQPGGPGTPPFGGAHHGEDGFLARMAERLELSTGQIDEIEALVESHRETTAPLRAQARATHDAVRKLVEKGVFDESAVRAAAEKAAAVQVELAVERARLHSRVQSVLTPEQRERAAELRAERQERGFRGHGRHGRGRRAWRP